MIMNLEGYRVHAGNAHGCAGPGGAVAKTRACASPPVAIVSIAIDCAI